MNPVFIDSVAEVFQISVLNMQVTVTDDGELGNVLVTNSDGSTITVPFTAGSSVGATRDAIEAALTGNAAITALYAVADQSTDAVRLTQLGATGPFTMEPFAVQGTTTLVVTTITAASQSPVQFKLDLSTAVAGSTSDLFLARETGRGTVGEYTLAANAVTTLGASSILVDDTNGLLAPQAGPQPPSEENGIMLDGTEDASDVPEWAHRHMVDKRDTALTVITDDLSDITDLVDPAFRTITDADGTVLTTDRTIYVASTTSATPDWTLTFAVGLNGQRVTVIMSNGAGTDDYVSVGIEVGQETWAATGDVFTFEYNLADDKWFLV